MSEKDKREEKLEGYYIASEFKETEAGRPEILRRVVPRSDQEFAVRGPLVLTFPDDSFFIVKRVDFGEFHRWYQETERRNMPDGV